MLWISRARWLYNIRFSVKSEPCQPSSTEDPPVWVSRTWLEARFDWTHKLHNWYWWREHKIQSALYLLIRSTVQHPSALHSSTWRRWREAPQPRLPVLTAWLSQTSASKSTLRLMSFSIVRAVTTIRLPWFSSLIPMLIWQRRKLWR